MAKLLFEFPVQTLPSSLFISITVRGSECCPQDWTSLTPLICKFVSWVLFDSCRWTLHVVVCWFIPGSNGKDQEIPSTLPGTYAVLWMKFYEWCFLHSNGDVIPPSDWTWTKDLLGSRIFWCLAALLIPLTFVWILMKFLILAIANMAGSVTSNP